MAAGRGHHGEDVAERRRLEERGRAEDTSDARIGEGHAVGTVNRIERQAALGVPDR
jgi:hypothetical protein